MRKHCVRLTLLPARQWDETALRIKSTRLLGSQSLQRYQGRKMDRKAVDAEQKANHALGLKLGCWKSGVLVENDEGAVAKYYKETEGAPGAA